MQGTRKSWQSGQDKMLCTDRPHERLNICLVFYILNEKLITYFIQIIMFKKTYECNKIKKELETIKVQNMKNVDLKNETPTCGNTVLAAVQFKENDVFEFRYKPEEVKKRFEPYHCFDGTLVVKKHGDGKIYLVDTFWSVGDNRTFTPEKAIEQGELTFLCNLEEMVDIKEHETLYYADADIVKMYIHAGYRSRFLIKKGTQRSQGKMLQSIKQKIEYEHSKIRMAENSIKWHNETLKKIEEGDTSVYL